MILERENPINLKLVINEQIDRKAWNDFNNSHPAGNIFQSPDFYLLNASVPFYQPLALAAKDNSDDIVGLLLSVKLKEKSGIAGIFSTRSIIIGGPITKSNDQETASFLLKEYHNLVRKKAIYSQFRNIHKIPYYSHIFEKYGYKYGKHLNVLIDLSKSENQLWKELHQERKRNIKSTLKKGLLVKEIFQENDIETAIELILNTYKKIKLPLAPSLFFRNIKKILGDKAKFIGGYYYDRLIAVRILLCFSDRVYDWYSASDYEYRDKYPNDLLPWYIIVWAKKAGYRIFDFGGAGKPDTPYGVRNYKMKFGGELVEYGRFEKIHNIVLYKCGIWGIYLYKKLNL